MGDITLTITTPPDVTINTPEPPPITLEITGGLSGGTTPYVHMQSTPSTTWTINHNRGQRPAVAVFDTGSRLVITEVIHTSDNQTIVSFLTPTAGFARLT